MFKSVLFKYHEPNYIDELPSSITDLPELVMVALALALKHLTSFQLTEALLQPAFFNTFSSRTHMLLNSNTIRNLWVTHTVGNLADLFMIEKYFRIRPILQKQVLYSLS